MKFLYKKFDSTVINQSFYNKKNNILILHFNTGSFWLYLDIDIEVYDALINAHSAGSYFNQHIRNYYNSHKITDISDFLDEKFINETY